VYSVAINNYTSDSCQCIASSVATLFAGSSLDSGQVTELSLHRDGQI